MIRLSLLKTASNKINIAIIDYIGLNYALKVVNSRAMVLLSLQLLPKKNS